MEVGNLGDKCNIRLDQLNSHGSNIIKLINLLLKQERTRPCMGGLFLQELEMPLDVPKIEDMLCSTSATHSYQGNLQDLGRQLDVPKVGDMLNSTPSTHPYQGDLQKAQE